MTSPRLSLIWAAASLLVSLSPVAGQPTEQLQSALYAIEVASHQRWLEGDLAALDELMADEFHFVVMNGAVETKAEVISAPYSGEGALRVQSLRVEPEMFALRGNVAVVISILHLDATVRGRPLAPRMRVLSVFTEDEGPVGWRLTARSITPIVAPPE